MVDDLQHGPAAVRLGRAAAEHERARAPDVEQRRAAGHERRSLGHQHPGAVRGAAGGRGHELRDHSAHDDQQACRCRRRPTACRTPTRRRCGWSPSRSLIAVGPPGGDRRAGAVPHHGGQHRRRCRSSPCRWRTSTTPTCCRSPRRRRPATPAAGDRVSWSDLGPAGRGLERDGRLVVQGADQRRRPQLRDLAGRPTACRTPTSTRASTQPRRWRLPTGRPAAVGETNAFTITVRNAGDTVLDTVPVGTATTPACCGSSRHARAEHERARPPDLEERRAAGDQRRGLGHQHPGAVRGAAARAPGRTT